MYGHKMFILKNLILSVTKNKMVIWFLGGKFQTVSLQMQWLIPIKQSCGWSSCDTSTKLTKPNCAFSWESMLFYSQLTFVHVPSHRLLKHHQLFLNGQNIIYTYWSILSSTATITASLPLAWVRLFSLHSAHAHKQHIISYSNTPWDIFFLYFL